ncbi:hypothetical protein ABZ129_10700, partial [Streptomyces sp. NPDC006307]
MDTPGIARDEDFLRLDHQICFSLHAATRAFNGVYRTALKDLGLTYPQYLVMRVGALLVAWDEEQLAALPALAAKAERNDYRR